MASRTKNGASRKSAVADAPQSKSFAASSVIEAGTADKFRAGAQGAVGEKREPCLCGCGGIPRQGVFLPGHDSRVRHLGKQVLEGNIKQSEIPAPARKYLKEGGML